MSLNKITLSILTLCLSSCISFGSKKQTITVLPLDIKVEKINPSIQPLYLKKVNISNNYCFVSELDFKNDVENIKNIRIAYNKLAIDYINTVEYYNKIIDSYQLKK